jgi:hypothetical protein
MKYFLYSVVFTLLIGLGLYIWGKHKDHQNIAISKQEDTTVYSKPPVQKTVGRVHTIELHHGYMVNAIDLVPQDTREVENIYRRYDELLSKCPIQSEAEPDPTNCRAFNSYEESTRDARKALNTRLAEKYGVIKNGCYSRPFVTGFNYDSNYLHMTDNASGGSHAITDADERNDACMNAEKFTQHPKDETQIQDGAWGTKGTLIELSQKEAEIMSRLNRQYQMDMLYIEHGNPTYIREAGGLRRQMEVIVHPYIKDNTWFDGGWMCVGSDGSCKIIMPYTANQQ